MPLLATPPALARLAPWELPTATALIVVALAVVGPEPRALPLVYLAAVTPHLCSVDLAVRRLPNRVVLPGFAVAGFGLVGQWIMTGEWLLGSLVAGLAYLLFLLVPALAGGMGMGDVKLAGVLGVSAGLVGQTTAIVSPVTAFLLGGVVALVALRRGRGGSIPFGPFLLAGFWIAVALS